MKFTKRELKADIYGKEVTISFPTVKQVQEYSLKVNKQGEEEAAELLLGFLANLGLPKDVAESMESEHLQQLVENLMPAKKN